MRQSQKEAYKRYAAKHREEINENNRRWREKNKEKFYQMVLKRRKELAEELKEKGMMYTYLPKTRRESKMIQYLVKRTGINEDEARRLLIDNEWNIRKILEDMS